MRLWDERVGACDDQEDGDYRRVKVRGRQQGETMLVAGVQQAGTTAPGTGWGWVREGGGGLRKRSPFVGLEKG